MDSLANLDQRLSAFILSSCVWAQQCTGAAGCDNKGLTVSERREETCLLLHCCFTSTETVQTDRDGDPGRPPPLSHSLELWGKLFVCFLLGLSVLGCYMT